MSTIELFEDGGSAGLRRRAVTQAKSDAPIAPAQGLLGVLRRLPSPEVLPVVQQKRPSQRVLHFVRYDTLLEIAETNKLNDVRRALLGMRLQRCRQKFLEENVAYKKPSDPAALEQLGEIRASVERLAKLDRKSRRYRGAMSAVIEAEGSAAAEASPVPLSIGVQANVLERSVLSWIMDAGRALHVIKRAEMLLSTGHPAPSMATPVVGPETALYGYRLPRLYEMATGLKFGISRTDNKVNLAGGVAFVVAAANAIGAPTTKDNVSSHYNKAKRAGLWSHVSHRPKITRRVTRDRTNTGE